MDDVTKEQMIAYDKLVREGGEYVIKQGAQLMLDFQNKKRDYQEIVNLSIGMLQGACQVFRLMVANSKPAEARNEMVEEVAQCAFDDLMSITKAGTVVQKVEGELDEQRGANDDTSKDGEEAVQKSHSGSDV